MIKLKKLLEQRHKKEWHRGDSFPPEVTRLIEKYARNDSEALRQITARGKGESIKTNKPKDGIWAYVWRMARFHSGIDPKMPVVATWDLGDEIEKQTGWYVSFAILESPTKKILDLLDRQVDRLLIKIPGVDQYGAARRWKGLIY